MALTHGSLTGMFLPCKTPALCSHSAGRMSFSPGERKQAEHITRMPRQFGPFSVDTPLVLAPMAGVSDRVYRQLCLQHGASWAPSEMTSADLELRQTEQTRRRLDLRGEHTPQIVQIAGADPQEMADAAQAAVALGAACIDINMGCPAKRGCHRLAGSALLRDEALVGQILAAVVQAVAVPVTLKTRTGWSPETRNAVRIARIAEDAGIAWLSLHGRTRACAYQGEAEYDTIAAFPVPDGKDRPPARAAARPAGRARAARPHGPRPAAWLPARRSPGRRPAARHPPPAPR